MPSNDFNGDPILVLSLEDAKEVHDAIVNPMTCDTRRIYSKVSKFLREVENDSANRSSSRVHQKRLWPE